MKERELFPPIEALTLSPEQASILAMWDLVFELRAEVAGLREELAATRQDNARTSKPD